MRRRLIYLIPFILVFGMILTGTASAELVSWWKLDDGSGNIAVDSAGGNDGTLMGDTTWVEGILDGALSFDGDGDYVDCGNDPIFNPSGSFSITIWAYISDWGTGWAHSMFSKGGDHDRGGWVLRRYESEVLVFTGAGFTATSQEEDHNLSGNSIPPLEEWVHFACTYDVNNVACIYINGNEDARIVASGTIEENDAPVYIGTRTNIDGDAPDSWADSYFTGVLDDARFYDHALGEADIKLVMEGKAALPATLTANPRPADGAVEVPRDVVLSWREGISAVTHNVYFGTDVNDVNEASVDDPRGVLVGQGLVDAVYDPDGLLDFGQKYYWRVDEVNDAEEDSPWAGKVWSFTVANFVVVDDFEDYNDYEPDTIYFAWADGFNDPTNGSTSGYPEPIFSAGEHFVEVDIVRSGLQSYPYFYDNIAFPKSEATKTLTSLTDWTRDDVVMLTLFYYGDPNNAAEPMYVTLDGIATVVNDNLDAIQVAEWTRWDIDLQMFADQGVNLANVGEITIGFGDNPPGGAGLVFFDDIRLYRPEP